jgi:hypothetical protein
MKEKYLLKDFCQALKARSIGIITRIFPRLVARDAACAARLKERTLSGVSDVSLPGGAISAR